VVKNHPNSGKYDVLIFGNFVIFQIGLEASAGFQRSVNVLIFTIKTSLDSQFGLKTLLVRFDNYKALAMNQKSLKSTPSVNSGKAESTRGDRDSNPPLRRPEMNRHAQKYRADHAWRGPIEASPPLHVLGGVNCGYPGQNIHRTLPLGLKTGSPGFKNTLPKSQIRWF
jgi:hypothetical protein